MWSLFKKRVLEVVGEGGKGEIQGWGRKERKKRGEEEAKTSLLRWEERSEVGGTCLLKGPLHSGTACPKPSGDCAHGAGPKCAWILALVTAWGVCGSPRSEVSSLLPYVSPRISIPQACSVFTH